LPSAGEEGPPFLLDPALARHLSADLDALVEPVAPVALRGRGAGCGVLFLLVFVLSGVFLAGAAVHEWRVWWALRSRGVDAAAVVVRLWTNTDESTSYHVRFRVEPTDGAAAEAEDQVAYAAWGELEVGGRVEVRYAADEPALARTLPLRSGQRWSVSALAVVWNALVWPLWVISLREVWRSRRLARDGRLRRGRVVAASVRKDRDGDAFLKVEYAFEDPAGWELRGVTEVQPRTPPTAPAPGAPLRVLWVDDRIHRAL
jgi:hypothetical protein